MIKYVKEPQMGFDAFEIDSFKMCIYSIIDKIKINAGELIFLFSTDPWMNPQ